MIIIRRAILSHCRSCTTDYGHLFLPPLPSYLPVIAKDITTQRQLSLPDEKYPTVQLAIS